MRKSILPLLSIVVGLVFTTTPAHTKEIDFWFTPMSTEGPAKAPLLKWTQENFPKLLPQGITIGRQLRASHLSGRSTEIYRSGPKGEAGRD